MSDKQSIDEALKAAGVPDYMVLVINKIMGAEDAIREMMAALSARSVDIHHREQVLESREVLFEERQKAFGHAVEDMKQFASRLYGPDSELSKINQKLGAIEMAGANRDRRYADRFTALDENMTRFKDSVDERFKEAGARFVKIEERVTELERKVG